MIVGPTIRLLPVFFSWVNVKPLMTAFQMPLSSQLCTHGIVVWFRLDLPSLLIRMSGRTESKAYRSLERLHLLHPFYLQGLSLYHTRKLNWSGMICSSKSYAVCYPVCYVLLGDCKLIILMIYLSNFSGTVFQADQYFLFLLLEMDISLAFFSSFQVFLDTYNFFYHS